MRTRFEVLRELEAQRGRLRSMQKTAFNTDKRTTAELADKIIPSIERKIAMLELEYQSAPEAPPRDESYERLINHAGLYQPTPQGELSIPEFLRR